VNDPVSAGIVTDSLAFCQGSEQVAALGSVLDGESTGGTWTELSASPSTGGAFSPAAGTFSVKNQAPGQYRFRYAVFGTAPCPNASSEVLVLIHPTPLADAGTDKTLTCNQPTATIGTSGSSSGTGIQYQWTLQGADVAQTATTSVTEGGTYALVVSNAFGCSHADEVSIREENEPPVADTIGVVHARCFGEKNGKIYVDEITGGAFPVLYSLNGSPFTQLHQFNGLAAGSYVLTMQDANGCEWTSDTIRVQQPPQLVPNLGADLKIVLSDSAHVFLEISPVGANIDTILWSPLFDPASAGLPYQHFFPTKSEQVDVRVIDSAGCEATDRLLVIMDKRRHVFVPNVIRPDAADNNTAVVFGGADVEAVKSFQIFDRWGTQVFGVQDIQPNQQDAGWDGRFRGKNLAPGVYVYYVVVRFIDGEEELFKGDITILR
jgi:hypothetical protein